LIDIRMHEFKCHNLLNVSKVQITKYKLFILARNECVHGIAVSHTSTHGVTFVRIQDAALKCAARGSLEIQDAKITQKSPSWHHRTTLLGCIFATEAYIDNRKKHVKQQYLLHMSSQYGELRPTNG